MKEFDSMNIEMDCNYNKSKMKLKTMTINIIWLEEIEIINTLTKNEINNENK